MNRVFQIYEATAPVFAPAKPLRSSIRLPYAPQFFIEVAEGIANWLTRTFRMGDIAQDRVEYREITVDPRSFEKTAYEHASQFMARTGEWPEVILMGRSAYFGLIGELSHMLRFRCEIRYHSRGLKHAQLFGIEVVCVPWMEGIIALPSLNEIGHAPPRQ